MVERLARGPATVSTLAGPLCMSLPAVIQHLRLLEASGIVRSKKVGRVRTCELDPKALSGAEAWFAHLHAEWERRLDRLGGYLEDIKKEAADDNDDK